MGQVQFWGGQVLFVGGQVAMHEDCCCEVEGEPCSDCTVEPQPDSVITLVDDECDDVDFCDHLEGAIPYTAFWNGIDCCEWEWRRVVGTKTTIMSIIFVKATEKFYAVAWIKNDEFGNMWQAWFGGDVFPCEDAWWVDTYAEIFGVSCKKGTGFLAGAFTLNGLNIGQDCTGCTIDVTLGG